ncbi:S8 family serine peptidase [Shewanella gelidimarina]|uniref:S8 family serine peptidase n=1 Tax=Shewanella gelidimarina TaxID=56813 RepID=UPI002010865F|nr:S8 family serine peptidase [Shewanella gelidimarina]MCL1058857.1 S8 family serine peptidase [Shewanella gelidimarina]
MYKKTILSICITTAILAGCGSDKNDSNKNILSPTSSDVTVSARQSVTVTGTLTGNDKDSDITFSIVDPDSVKLGKLVITDAAKGTFTYTTSASEGVEVINFKVSDGVNKDSISELTINIDGGDPLYTQQWHLNNTAQNSFSLGRGLAGNDLNVEGAISSGATGKGIIVAVVDNGVEISHEDLQNNVIAGGSYNLITGTNNPTPFANSAAHGTEVAGIIAAEGWNGIGGRGVAPDASLVGFNFLDQDPLCAQPTLDNFSTCLAGVQTFSNFAKSHGKSAFSDTARVFNQSYGYSPTLPFTADTDEDELMLDVVNHGPDGNGSLFVKAAGNGFQYFKFQNAYWAPSIAVIRGEDNNHGLPFHNANMSPDNTNVFNLVVSATNAAGQLSSYSSIGSNVFVAGAGGEYGVEAPAMVTTDRMTCTKGSATTNDRPSTGFMGGAHPLNEQCNYSSTMNGTSAATPSVAGVIALILSANPDLNWRDVREILAKTSTKINPELSPIMLDVAGKADFEAMGAWIDNAAGYHFNNLYGFGRVDATAAVNLARAYKVNLGVYVISDWTQKDKLDKAIPDGNPSGVTDSNTVLDNLVIEGVQIELNIDHKRLPDLAIELISPSGTHSMVMTPYNGFTYQGVADQTKPDEIVTGYVDTPMLSNAFYGEESAGDWTLKVTDVNNGQYSFWTQYRAGTAQNPTANKKVVEIPNDANGLLKGWSIRFHGHAAS